MRTILTMTLFILLSLSVYSQGIQFINVDAKNFNSLISSQKGTLLDVRTTREFDNQHIKGALQLNFYEASFSKKLLLLPKNEPIYLYCTTGYRSQRAAQILVGNGYTQVYNLYRGIMGWNANSLPTQRKQSAVKNKVDKVSFTEFESIKQSNKLVLYDFYAPWCAPCKKMLPYVNSLTSEYKGKITIKKVNVDYSQNLVKQLKVTGVPYFSLYKNNKLVWEHNGYISKEDLVKVLEDNK